MLEVVKTKQDFVVAFGQESLLTPIASRQVDGGCLFVAVSICNKARGGEASQRTSQLSQSNVCSLVLLLLPGLPVRDNQEVKRFWTEHSEGLCL